jgi:hypothetical protein
MLPVLGRLRQPWVSCWWAREANWAAVDPHVVTLCQERLVRALRSHAKERPDAQADALLSYLMQVPHG